jgi:peptidoglycan/LPS O-acetylase OafA/YrhL
MHPTKYQWLDLLRGVSALLVCANHLRGAMFVDFASLHGASAWIKLFYFVTSLGGQSVIVFFVLSGFFVGGSVVRRWDKFDYLDYLIARVNRLWIVLVPALLLTFVVDQVTWRQAPSLLAGADLPFIHSGPAGDYSSSPATLLQNLFFLQTVTAPVFGSNGPLWSLSNEFWYYVCFPLFFLLFDRRKSGRVQAVAAGAIVLLGLSVLQDKVLGFAVWTLGVVVYCLPRGQRVVPPWLLCAVASFVLLGALAASKTHVLPAALDMAVLGLASSLMIVALRDLPPMGRVLAVATDWLSRASYTLYLVHFPLVLLWYAVLFRGQQAQPTAGNCLLFLAALAGLVMFAQVFWMLFEKHTDEVKSRVSALLRRPGSKPTHS